MFNGLSIFAIVLFVMFGLKTDLSLFPFVTGIVFLGTLLLTNFGYYLMLSEPEEEEQDKTKK